jgi:hypothetical protein
LLKAIHASSFCLGFQFAFTFSISDYQVSPQAR